MRLRLFLALHRQHRLFPFIVVGDMNIANKRPARVGNELVPFFHMKRACHSPPHALTCFSWAARSRFRVCRHLGAAERAMNDLLYYFPVLAVAARCTRGASSPPLWHSPGLQRRIEAWRSQINACMFRIIPLNPGRWMWKVTIVYCIIWSTPGIVGD